MSTDEEFEEEAVIFCPGRVFPDVIFEQVANGTYVVWDRCEQKFQVGKDAWRKYKHDGLTYAPLSRLPWLAATLPTEYETEEALFNEVRQFFVDHLDVSNDLLYDVYACFVLASWRPEDFTVVPYLFFLGPLASGKTRALECFHRLCYRSIMAASMSASSLFRALEIWHPTLLLDETEIYNRESMVEVLALLNSGYRKGQYAIRIEKVANDVPQIGFFDVFGFKILSGTEELAATLQSRCIITSMSRAVRPVNLFVDEAMAQVLRNKLLMYRFRNLGKTINASAITDYIKLNGYFKNARVIELFISLLHVAPTEAVRQRLQECIKKITQSRLDEEQASIEGRVFDALLKCEDKVENGKLSTQAVTCAFNEGLSEKEQVTSRFIGRIISRLGFEKCKLSGGGLAGFFWDAKLVERLKLRYCAPSNLTPQTPETPHSPQTMEKPASLPVNQRGESGENSPEVPSQTQSHFSMKSGESGENRKSGVGLERGPIQAENVLKLERLTTNIQDKCMGCGSNGRMDWQVTLHDGTWGLLCAECGLKLSKKLEGGLNE